MTIALRDLPAVGATSAGVAGPEPKFAASLLEERPAPRGLLAGSLACHAAALALLTIYRLVVPSHASAADDPIIVQFVRPWVPEAPVAEAPPERTIEAPRVAPPAVVEPPRVEASRPSPRPPVPETVEEPPTPVPEVRVDEAPPPVTREVRTNVFEREATPRTDPTTPATRVLTGGFASAADGDRSVGPAVALAAGPRTGTFGGAVRPAAASGSRPPRRAPVLETGFEKARPATERSRPEVKAVERPERLVEIVSKPKPVYTDEARALRLEGEVVLEVLFAAIGRASVVRIVKGLGHGLDEAAVRAAEGIRFKPALREGRPVDHVATLRVVFQLA